MTSFKIFSQQSYEVLLLFLFFTCSTLGKDHVQGHYLANGGAGTYIQIYLSWKPIN